MLFSHIGIIVIKSIPLGLGHFIHMRSFSYRRGYTSDGILGHHHLTKDSSLLPHAIHSLFYWRILQEPYSILVFKIHKKIRKTSHFYVVYF
jgi:hypothetical protein